MFSILDGTGAANRAKVDANNDLHTYSKTISAAREANKNGDSYNINTGVITLTNDTETPVLYLKNNEDRDLVIEAIVIGYDTSTNGAATETIKATVIRNPITGTIITSTPTVVDINSNRNFGSNNSLTVDAYKGATGDTMTDGTDHIIFFQPDFGRLFATIDEVLPKGSSIGLKIAPPAGNTSLPLYVAIICYLENANL